MVGLVLVLALGAEDLTPEKFAKVQKDRDQAMTDIAKKFGNKKSSELTSDERREMIRDQRAAENAVLDKNGVDPKDFARYEAKMNLSDRAAAKGAREELDKKELEEKKAAEAAAAKQGNQEIQIQRGFNDSNPVILEEKPAGNGDTPVVEKSLPPEAQADQAEASGGNKGGSDDPAAAAKKSSGKKK